MHLDVTQICIQAENSPENVVPRPQLVAMIKRLNHQVTVLKQSGGGAGELIENNTNLCSAYFFGNILMSCCCYCCCCTVFIDDDDDYFIPRLCFFAFINHDNALAQNSRSFKKDSKKLVGPEHASLMEL